MKHFLPLISSLVYAAIIMVAASFFLNNIYTLSSVGTQQAYAQATCTTQEECREELEELNEKIEEIQQDIQSENSTQRTLSQEINVLNQEINQTESNIAEKNTLIQNLRSEIVRKENSLQALNERLAREKETLEQIIQKRYELDDATLFEVILSSESISEFYEDAPEFGALQDSLSESFAIIDTLKVDIYNQKSELEEKQNEESDERYSLQLERNRVTSQREERDTALNISETREAGFEELKRIREQQVQEIRARLISFQGSGVTQRSISFGEAYDYAKDASNRTGVRTAFIMAIMQQETGFGRNVGGCYLKNGETAEGIYIKSGNPSIRNMVPGNFENFKRITSSLGRDWQTTPISCAAYINGQVYGHGGAMGYTQFIPNTWMSVEARVRSYLGAAVADPWNPQHAVMATAVFLQDLGATTQTYSAEHNAACRYYGSCSVYNYGEQVMQKAANIQISIDQLERE